MRKNVGFLGIFTVNATSVAYFATRNELFALAQKDPFPHLEPAFQASSPKTSQGRVGNDPAFFYVRSGARPASENAECRGPFENPATSS